MVKLSRSIKTGLWLAVLIFSLWSIKAYLPVGFIYTHDGENHLARFANYKIALRERQFPPRLAPNLLNHYGYPVFNFNYPLANILSVPFSILGVNYETTFKIIILVFLFWGGVGVIKWLEVLTANDKQVARHVDTRSQIFALAVYYSAYYLVNMLLYRGNIGEVIAYGLLPWILLWSVRPKATLSFTLLWTGFLLAHNVMAFFGSVLVGGLFLINLIGTPPKKAKIFEMLASPLLALGLSLWFWLPAVAEMKYVAAGNSELVSETTLHFPTLHQLLFAPLQFGYSYAGSLDSLGFSLGAVQWLCLIIISLIILKNWLGKNESRLPSYVNRYFMLAILLIFLQLPPSKPIWDFVKPMNLIQFPWRLSFFVSILIVPSAYFLFSQLNRVYRNLIILVLVSQIFYISNLHPVDRFSKSELEYDLFSNTSTTQNENMPSTFKYLLFGDWQPQPKLSAGKGEIQVIDWNGSKRAYRLLLESESLIIEPTAYFLGWQTQATNTLTGDATQVQYIDDGEIQGRLAYWLPQGEYLIKTSFSQNTWSRVLGNGVSLVCLMILLGKGAYNLCSKH